MKTTEWFPKMVRSVSSWDLYPAGRMVWEKGQNIKAGIYIQRGGWYGRRIRVSKLGSISSGADGMGEGSEYQSWDLYPAGRMVWEKDQSIKAGVYIQRGGWYGRRIRISKLGSISSGIYIHAESISTQNLYPRRIYIHGSAINPD